MKILNNIFLIAMLSSIVLFGCTKDDISGNPANATATGEINDKEKLSNNKAICESNCLFSGCELQSCPAGTSGECKCSWFSAKCRCNPVEQTSTPSQTTEQETELDNFRTHMSNNMTPASVASDVVSALSDIQDAIDNNNVSDYNAAVTNFINEMDNLSIDNQGVVDDYLISIGESPVFN